MRKSYINYSGVMSSKKPNPAVKRYSLEATLLAVIRVRAPAATRFHVSGCLLWGVLRRSPSGHEQTVAGDCFRTGRFPPSTRRALGQLPSWNGASGGALPEVGPPALLSIGYWPYSGCCLVPQVARTPPALNEASAKPLAEAIELTTQPSTEHKQTVWMFCSLLQE